MRYFVFLTSFLASLVFIGVSAGMNVKFGTSFAQNEQEYYLWAGASVAADIWKALGLIIIGTIFSRKDAIISVGALCLWALCLAFSVSAAIGFAAFSRLETTAARQDTSDQRATITAKLKKAQGELSQLAFSRPAAVVDQAISAHQQNRRWRSTKQCSNATAKASREFCKEYFNLKQELAVAQDKLRRNRQISQLEQSLSLHKPQASPDPQAMTISRLLQVEFSWVQIGLILLAALMLEAGSALGLTLVWKFFHLSAQNKKPDEKPASATPKTAKSKGAKKATATVKSTKPKFNKPDPEPKSPPAKPKIVAVKAPPKPTPATVAPQQPEPSPVQPAVQLVATAEPDRQSVDDFFIAMTTSQHGSRVAATTLFQHYKSWCKAERQEAVNLDDFIDAAQDLAYSVTEEARPAFLNIRLLLPDVDAQTGT